MCQSTVKIATNEQRELYYNLLIAKIRDFKKFQTTLDPSDSKYIQETTRLLADAHSFKNMFDIKGATVTLTRDDVNLLVRILNTSA